MKESPLILLVEDNPGDARLVSDELAVAGDVVVAERLSTALDVVSKRSVAVIVLDLMLPDSRGKATYLALRSAVPETPIAVLTGYQDPELEEHLRVSGAIAYLDKNTLAPNMLLQVVSEALVERQVVPADTPEAAAGPSSVAYEPTHTESIGSPLQEGSDDSNGSLPVHIPTLLLQLWARRRWIASLLLVGPVLGIVISLLFGTKTWTSSAVLQYQPWSDGFSFQETEAPLLSTQLHLVKVRNNLEETRLRCSLPCTVRSLGASCRVDMPKGSELLVVSSEWDNATASAHIANTLADVFLQAHRKQRRTALRANMGILEGKIRSATTLRDTAQQTLSSQESAMGRSERDTTLRRLEDELRETGLQRRKAESELKSLESQIGKLASIQEQVKGRIAKEKQAVAGLHNLAHLNVRVERIRAEIRDHREGEVNNIETKQWEERIAYLKDMLKKGYVSQVKYDAELSSYHKHLVKANDTEFIDQKKEELEKLYSKFSPTKSPTTASAPIMRDLLMQQFNLDLKFIGVHTRLKEIRETEKKAKAKIEAFSSSTGSVDELLKEVEYWEEERRELEDEVERIRVALGGDPSFFKLVNQATVPLIPTASNRKLLAGGVGVMFVTSGLLVVVGLVVCDTTIKSSGELLLHLSSPLLGVIPRHNKPRGPLLGTEEVNAREQYRLLAHRLRQECRSGSRRVLFSSAMPGEGCTTIVANLAESLASHGDQVLVVDANVRPGESDTLLGDVISGDDLTHPGLRDFLATEQQPWGMYVYPTDNASVACMPRGNNTARGDVLVSSRLIEMMREMGNQYDWVLIDGAAVHSSADALWTAAAVDHVVLAVLAEGSPAAVARTAHDSIAQSGPAMLGAVLNGASPNDSALPRRPQRKRHLIQQDNAPTQAITGFASSGLPALVAVYWLLMFLATHWRISSEGNGIGGIAYDKLMHCCAYALLAAIVFPLAATGIKRVSAGRYLGAWGPYLVTVVAIALYGALDELTQPFVGRTADIADYQANILGIAIGLGVATAIRYGHRWMATGARAVACVE